ncbi:hypothetical protein L7F22_004320 [Adiantum nelumboides]|nr:hypothetical protein [Adiantum nelumboides]
MTLTEPLRLFLSRLKYWRALGSRTIMYRAIVQDGFNAEEPVAALKVIEKPIPEATSGHVVVHIKLRPINPTDMVAIRTGRFTHFAKHPPTPGSEGYGVVHSVADDVKNFKVGDRVVPFMWEARSYGGGGSWQEYVSVKESMLTAVPASISDEVAAQFVINPWTVYGMLKDLAVPRGEYILQTAAGSVLGRQVIQLAKHWGIKTINIVRRPEQKEELKLLGADEVICSTTEDVITRVKELTEKRLAYGSLDCVGGALTKSVAASTRRGGNVFIYGVLAKDEAIVRIHDLFREVHVRGWILNNYWNVEERRKEFVEEVWNLLESHVLEPYTGEKFDLSDFNEAIKKSEEVGRGGKVLLTS